MRTRASWLTWFSAPVALGLAIVLWILFAPIQAGGRSAYVIVRGNSMEPGFHRGDLVVLRRATEYQVGDIATYQHPQIGPVIHRIIGREGDAFVFKGDNNAWLDAYRPTQAELIGRFWLYLPSAGKIVERLRTPWAFAFLVVAIALGGGLSVTSTTSRRRRRRRSQPARKENSTLLGSLHTSRADLYFVVALLILGSALLAMLAYSQPLTRTVTEDLAFQHTGVFEYTAAAPPGVYDGDAARTGQPIYRRLINRVDVRFTYRLATGHRADVQTSCGLAAELSNGSGWRSTLELQPATAGQGPVCATAGVLDLRRIETLLSGLEQQTGVVSPQYTLALAPTVTVKGALAGQEIGEQFSPRLTFRLDPLQLQLATDRNAGAGDPLAPVQSGALKRTRQQPNTLSFFGLRLDVATVRQIAVVGLAASLASVVGLVSLAWLHRTQDSEAARIRRKYGSLLVVVHAGSLATDGRIVEVLTIDDLAKVAERNGSMILHEERGAVHCYCVQDGAVIYRYQFGRPTLKDQPQEQAQP